MTKSRWSVVRILSDQFLPNPDRWGFSALVQDGNGQQFEVTTSIEQGEDATLASISGDLTRKLSDGLIDPARIIRT